MRNRVLVVKLPVKPRWKIRPCQETGCDIFTNKRYRDPASRVHVACMFNHAEAVYRRNGKAAAAALKTGVRGVNP